MKTNIMIFSLIFILSSCIKEPPDFTGKYIIQNNSNHLIQINLYLYNEIKDSIILPINNYKEYTYSNRGGIPEPPPFSADSLMVTYDDSITIIHYKYQQQNVSRSLLLPSCWLANQEKSTI